MLSSFIKTQRTSFMALPMCLYHNPYKTNQIPFKEWNIVRDDFVEVINGKFKGQKGKVL